MEKFRDVLLTSIIILLFILSFDQGAREAYSSDDVIAGKGTMQEGVVSLEVLNPRGVLESVSISGLTNTRPKNLAGKKIALLCEKPQQTYFFDALGDLVKKKYPTATILRFDSPAFPLHADNTVEVTAQCDIWIEGIKTSGLSVIDYEVKREKLGKPGVTFCIDSLLNQRKRLAAVAGIPTLRIIKLPAMTYLAAESYPEKMKSVVTSVFDATIEALTNPLTEEEKNPKPFVYDHGPLKFTGNSYTETVEKFYQHCVEHFMCDGLPVAPPTREAVDWMLTGTSRSPDEEIGIMAPRNGMATIEKIAINAVMAGARPEYLPVIIAAIECVTEKGFNLYHLVNSAGSPTPLIWVNGPIAKELGMNSGMGYLGRGNRANNTIGRAIGMCLINIGWRSPNTGYIGEPEGFCNFIFPENETDSPWPPFHVGQHFKPEESTVTINEIMRFNRSGPGGGMSSKTIGQSLDAIAGMLAGSAGTGGLSFGYGARYFIALNPMLARQIADAGFTKRSLAQWLYEKTHTIDDPKHVAILVTGDAVSNTVLWSGMGSTYINPDIADSIQNQPPTFMTKRIRGATLTKAGR
jgi:hypothetical protein